MTDHENDIRQFVTFAIGSQLCGVGGDAMDDHIVAHLRRAYNPLVGEETAERIKLEIGSASPPEDGDGMVSEIRGRDLVSGVPKELVISERELAECLAERVNAIVEAVRTALEESSKSGGR